MDQELKDQKLQFNFFFTKQKKRTKITCLKLSGFNQNEIIIL